MDLDSQYGSINTLIRCILEEYIAARRVFVGLRRFSSRFSSNDGFMNVIHVSNLKDRDKESGKYRGYFSAP